MIDQRARSVLRILANPAFENRDLNPYNALLYEHLEHLGVIADEWSRHAVRSGSHDVVHIHWPDLRLQERRWIRAFGNAAGTLRALQLLRGRGARIIWTAHNHRSHEHFHPRLERAYWWALTRLLDGHISLSNSAQAELLRRFPVLARLPGAVVPHGNYRLAYPQGVDRRTAREYLGISADVTLLCFVGRIRPYKNVTALVRAFRHLPGDNLRLLVAGEPEPDRIVTEIQQAAGTDERVLMRPGFIPEEQIPFLLGASDLLVLPYRAVLNSGTALLGLSFGRPVLAPRLGSLPDLQALVGADHLRTFEGEVTTQVLDEAVRWLAERPSVGPDLDATSWPVVASKTRDFYDAVLETATDRPTR